MPNKMLFLFLHVSGPLRMINVPSSPVHIVNILLEQVWQHGGMGHVVLTGICEQKNRVSKINNNTTTKHHEVALCTLHAHTSQQQTRL
jgi:hypothetical protein